LIFYYDLGKIDGIDNIAILSQIRLFSRNRLINKLGVVDNENFEILSKNLKDLIL
jgi:hypothetical protein